ncbi:MAG: LacI family DNA-binding transcriptional regulator [Verrucomicrobia bacterium]|nr:LacI family DNA-binding transcriptional regulator [Verrucomicrobiota bacterium]
MMRRVTTHDIAREAGVARTTVSHILNNRPGIIISPKTRERVLTIARKLGYVANSAAQMLVTGRSQTIGLILSRPDLISVDAFVPMMVFGLNEACRTQGYRLLMESIQEPAGADAYLDLAKSKRIDGMIVINPRKGDVGLRKVIESRFPVLVFGSSGHPKEHSVATQDGEASCRATTHLFSMGHRRVAHISYAPLEYLPAVKRLEGYRAAYKQAGLWCDKKLFAEADFTSESGYQAMKKILASNTRPTALFAGNDTVAIGAMTAIREAGLSIPENFAVVGYDDIPAAAFACPPLTTIRSHAFEQGKILGEAAIALVVGKGIRSQQDVISLELVIRASCGARRKNSSASPLHGANTSISKAARSGRHREP